MFLQTKVSLWWFGRRFGLLHSQATTAAAAVFCTRFQNSPRDLNVPAFFPIVHADAFPGIQNLSWKFLRSPHHNFNLGFNLRFGPGWGWGGGAGCRRRDLGNGIEDNDLQFINYGIYHLLDIVSG